MRSLQTRGWRASALVVAGLLGVGLLTSGTRALADTVDNTPDAKAPHATVVIMNFEFTGQLTVLPGGTITVQNADTAPHTLTAVDGSFTTKVIQPGKSVTFKAPKKAGDYPMTCQIHPEMSGTLSVVA